ncbi:MAG: hypothetical protein ACRDRR_11230 [Pseudonocardiaceae bacterium]
MSQQGGSGDGGTEFLAERDVPRVAAVQAVEVPVACGDSDPGD